MNEEELFCKLFPEYVVNGKPLSPYFDLFESGYEQSENCIAELEKENAELKLKLDALDEQIPWKDIKDKSEVIGKFTKAKEIIKELLSCCRNYPQENAEKIERAEQFLKE